MVSTGKMLAFINALGGSNSSPSEVVILPETEIAFDNTTTCPITTPFANKPTFGGTYKIIWDGVEYTTSNIVDATNTIGEGVIACYVLGNTDILGFTEMLGTNPDASANIFLALIPDGQQQDDVTMYGLLAVASEPVTTTAVLSIVQVGAASGGGSASAGGGIFRVVCENGEPTDDIGEGAAMGLIYTPDKTGTEILSAFNSGEYIFIDFINPMGEGSTVRIPVISAKDGEIAGGVVANGVSMVATVTWDAATTIIFEVYRPA